MSEWAVVLPAMPGPAYVHSTTVLHHRLMRGRQPSLREIANLGSVILQGLDGASGGRRFGDDETFFGLLIRTLNEISIAKDRVERRAFNWKTRVAPLRDPLTHFGNMLFDHFRQLRIVRFRDGANTVGKVCHRALDLIVVGKK